MPTPLPLPANSTKHLSLLEHPLPHDDGIVLPLKQISSESGTSTGTTGTTLWLGAQVLATYLSDTLPPSASSLASSRKTCLDLGSGVGYLPLCLAAWGWHVIATDIEPVVSSVLKPNIEAGLYAVNREMSRRGKRSEGVGSIEVQELDWMAYLPTESSASTPKHSDINKQDPLNGNHVDLILTTDTLYTPSLTLPLWYTLTSLAKLSRSRHPKGKSPELLLALENRDPSLIAEALEVGRGMGWVLKRVADTRVQKAVEKAGWGWGRVDWEGVEVWKGRLEGGSSP